MLTPAKMRLRWILTAVLAVAAARAATDAEPDRGFLDRVHSDNAGDHKYVVFVPHDYTTDKEWPVLLFLHGAGERGTDGKKHVDVGLGKAIRAREKTFPFIAVFPQCEDRQVAARRGWAPDGTDGARALAILTEVEKAYRTDKERVYLTGLSMGGFGTWAIAAAAPNRWAAIVPICGAGDPEWAPKIAGLPVWCFHGGDDRVVSPDGSRRMIEALKNAGATPTYTEYPGVGHNSWDAAFGTDELYTWLLKQKRTARTASYHAPTPKPSAVARAPKPNAGTKEETPFVPALEIPRAVYVRLGNEMLSALADSLPQSLAADALSGTLADQKTTTSADGRTFDVQLQGITYRGRLSRATIEPHANGRVDVMLAARDVNLLINRTTIRGDGKSATCGPLRIVLGHRTDLPLSFEVQPVVDQRRIKFKLLSTKFRLPRDNWSVGWPEWVNAHGLGMTEDRVSSSLREGLYGDPGRIEQEIIATVPRMLEQLEQQIKLDPIDRVVTSLWPLPVYAPQVKAWPSEIAVDAEGATVVVGVSVAAIDDQSPPPQPKVVELSQTGSANTVKGEQLQFGLAPELMEPLSAEWVASGTARVLIQDLPVNGFAPLADAKWLAEVVADLKQRGDKEVRSELVLAGPFRMRHAQNESGDALELGAPRAMCSIAVRPQPDSDKWVPYLEIEFRLRQLAKPELTRPTPNTRALALVWQGQATIDVLARFAPGYTASDMRIDTDRLREVLAAGWREWTETGPLARVPMEDIDLGFAKLRMAGVSWHDPYLAATFAPAGIAIRNLTSGPVAYEVKGPYSEWGGPYTLDPEQDHAFPVAYPVTCRFRSNKQEKVFTLPPGERFEFQSTADGSLDLYLSQPEPPKEPAMTSPR